MTDPVVAVTGAARGIGAAIARRLAADGAHVALLDIDGTVRDAAAAIPDGRGHAYEVDITRFEQVERAVDRITDELGGVTGVVNNAGWSPAKRFLDTSLAEQQRVIDINYVGALHVCRAFLPPLLEAGEAGRIVFVGSDAARVGVPKEAVYAGAKAALLGFAKSLAVEVARDRVTVNVVSPGSTDTELLRGMLTDEQIERRIRGNPMRRVAAPADIAAAVAFFLGPDAAYVTGQILSVNGGMSRLG